MPFWRLTRLQRVRKAHSRRHKACSRRCMQPNYTTRAAETLRAAQELAAASSHAELTPLHLAVSLLKEADGVPAAVLRKLEADPRVLAGELALELEKLPRATGQAQGQVGGSRALLAVLNEAQAAMRRLGDEFVSTEHLLLGLAQQRRARGAGSLPGARALGPAHRGGAERGARRAQGDLAGPRGDLRGAREVRARPDRGGARGQARPGHRARRRDPARDAGALAPAQEQPGADRRPGRRQDGHRRGAGQPHRRRRRARGAQGQARAWRSTSARCSRAPSTAASSRSA